MLSQMARVFFFLMAKYFRGGVYHTFFIQSSIKGPLDYFHVLTIVDNAVVNITMHISFQDSDFVFLHIFPKVELLYYMVFLFLTFFEEPPYCFL